MTGEPRVGCLMLSVGRLLAGVLVVAAILATFAETASRTSVNPFNFFGYFTIQSNTLFAAAALLAGLIGLFRPGASPHWITLLRSLTTVCMIVVGLVYAILLAPLGLEGGVPVPWANWMMHVVAPILAVADWIFARDGRALQWRIAFLQLIYPLVWTAVVLFRGATDGWVPYPFLDPGQGHAVVLSYVAIIAAVFTLVSISVVWWSRFTRSSSASLSRSEPARQRPGGQ